MSTQYITSIGLFYKNVVILLGGLSDCEELVGVNQTCQNLPLNSLKPLSMHILLS